MPCLSWFLAAITRLIQFKLQEILSKKAITKMQTQEEQGNKKQRQLNDKKLKKHNHSEYRKKILNEFTTAVGIDLSKARNLIQKLQCHKDPYLLAMISQTYYDESAFDEKGSPREFFEGRKLRMAEKYAIRAVDINFENTAALWMLGKIRNAYGQKDLAIFLFKEIIRLGTKNVVTSYEGKDLDFAKMIVNDAKFQIYRIYHDLKMSELSRRYLAMYKDGLKKSIKTIFKPLKRFLMD